MSNGQWKTVPVDATPEIIAAAALAVWPVASKEDIEIARRASKIVLMSMDQAPGTTLESLAASLATMAPAYRAMLAAAPDAPDAAAEVARLRAEVATLTEQRQLWLDKDLTAQALVEQESEIERLRGELEESDAIREKCARLLAETAVALKGPEKALHRHGWQDLPEYAANLTAALGKAREALESVTEAVDDYYNEKSSVRALFFEALAAIGAVSGGKGGA